MINAKKTRLSRTGSLKLIMGRAAETLATGKRFPHSIDECKGKLEGIRTALFFFEAEKEAALVDAMWRELHEFTPEVPA